jgi:hypothetical protein
MAKKNLEPDDLVGYLEIAELIGTPAPQVAAGVDWAYQVARAERRLAQELLKLKELKP